MVVQWIVDTTRMLASLHQLVKVAAAFMGVIMWQYLAWRCIAALPAQEKLSAKGITHHPGSKIRKITKDHQGFIHC
jgi:hypothetical protein